MTQRYFTMFFESKFKNNLEDLVEGPDHLKSLKVYFNASSFQFSHPKCATHCWIHCFACLLLQCYPPPLPPLSLAM